jgi:uncharacterized protein (UPF0264 family)
MTRVLVSVRSRAEALMAGAAGAHLIDLKDPAAGALGGLPVETIRETVAALRTGGVEAPISATIGDVPLDQADEIDRRIAAVAACGVDLVKVGLRGSLAAATLERLAAYSAAKIVPVLIADDGVDARLVAHAARLGFAAVMLDTQDKRAGSLFERIATHELAAARQAARTANIPFGLAGALRLADLPRIARLDPDFAGFRSAVCAGARSGALDGERVRELVAALAGAVLTV